MTVDVIDLDKSYEWCLEERIEADSREFDIIRTEPDVILLDLDDTESKRHYESTLPILANRLGLKEHARWRSRSGDGWHVVLKCPDLPILERILIQAVLGSDRKREALAILMVKDGIEKPSYLRRPKTKVLEESCSAESSR